MNHVLVPGHDAHNGKVYHLPSEDDPDSPKCHHNKVHDSKYIRKDPDVIPSHRPCKNCTGTYKRVKNRGQKLTRKLEKMDPRRWSAMSDELVYVSPGYASRTYHTDESCGYVRDRHREWPKERAEAWDYTHCKRCQKSNPVMKP